MNNDSLIFNPSNTMAVAKELTVKAIENGLIVANEDSVLVAKRVTDFYKTVLATLNPDK